MCGIIGVALEDATHEDLELISRLFRESMIRGRHATGWSAVKDGKIQTHKVSIPADDVMNNTDLEIELVDRDGSITMVGHVRYATSSLNHHQPIADEEVSVVHNGVVSQEPQEDWKYKTRTDNDTELLYESLRQNNHPLEDFPTASAACCVIHKDYTLSAFRNHERPLWYTLLPRGIVFTSTRDIAARAGLLNPQRCDMWKTYHFANNELSVININHDNNTADLQP